MATHITHEERRSIERYRKDGKGVNTIAKRLGRSKSSISEELQHNSVKGIYRADRAHQKAEVRRKRSKQQCLKVAMNPALKAYVEAAIRDDQSPEGVAGRIRYHEPHLQNASPKAIYKFVHSPHGGPLEHHLYQRRVKRKGGPKRGTTPARDTTKVSIESRPSEAEKRQAFGHFEGDLIESGQDGEGSLLVLVERMTRYPFLLYTSDKSTEHLNRLIADTLGDAPVLSITLDNDVCFQRHEELSDLIEATVFFCHPYCSHEKGTVENRNKGIREFVPKRSDLSQVPEEIIKKAETHLRTRYMKCLDYRTPQEAWEEELAKAEACATIRKTPRRARVSLQYRCSD